jgi:hypothetical protein
VCRCCCRRHRHVAGMTPRLCMETAYAAAVSVHVSQPSGVSFLESTAGRRRSFFGPVAVQSRQRRGDSGRLLYPLCVGVYPRRVVASPGEGLRREARRTRRRSVRPTVTPWPSSCIAGEDVAVSAVVCIRCRFCFCRALHGLSSAPLLSL